MENKYTAYFSLKLCYVLLSTSYFCLFMLQAQIIGNPILNCTPYDESYNTEKALSLMLREYLFSVGKKSPIKIMRT